MLENPFIKKSSSDNLSMPKSNDFSTGIPSWERFMSEYQSSGGTLSSDPLTQLMSAISGQDSKTNASTLSDDTRNWISAAQDYAKSTGSYPNWEWLEQWGVPVGQAYTEPDTSSVIGVASPSVANTYGLQEGDPVTEKTFGAIQGSQDYQTFADETYTNQQIAKIVEATGYPYQTAKYIYERFMSEPEDMTGSSNWAKNVNTPQQMKDMVNSDVKTGITDENGLPVTLDTKALDQFYQTSNQYTPLRSFNEFMGSPSVDKINGQDMSVRGAISGSGSDNDIDLSYVHDNYFSGAVDVVNKVANQLKSSGDIGTLMKFVKESGIDSNDTFSIGEAMNALKWLANNGQTDAQSMWSQITNDKNVYKAVPTTFQKFTNPTSIKNIKA